MAYLLEAWRLLRRGRRVVRSPEPLADVARETFCIRPFRSFNIVPSGATKVCDAFEDFILENGRTMSVYEHTFEEIWNSKELRGIRRAMVDGRKVDGCEYCYRQERLGLESERLHETVAWQSGLANPRNETVEDIRAQATRAGHQAAGPENLYIDLGNLCNLKCRSCHGLLSSSIERDPVHTAWTTPLYGPTLARWNEGLVPVAPRRVLGVAYSGISDVDFSGEQPTAWTDGDARIVVPREASFERLVIDISAAKQDELAFSLSANDVPLFSGPLPRGPWHAEFDLPKPDEDRIELRMQSWRGVGVTALKVGPKSRGPQTGVAFTRLSTTAEWFRHDGFLHDELLRRLSKPAALNIIGGEPLINADVLALMRHLVTTGDAPNIGLALTTNATVVRDEWCALAERFKTLTIAVSLDGCGDVFEYIRHPARWDVVIRNFERLRRLRNAYVYVHATVQAYNIIGIGDLFTYCDEHQIPFRYHVLEYPRFLNAWTMPVLARRHAASQLRDHLRSARLPQPNVARLASALEAGPEPDGTPMRDFMAFTNDLDATRGQTFAKVHPELLELISASGVVWSTETRYARLAER